MKRSELVKILAPIVGGIVRAELAINQLEELDMLKPKHKITVNLKDLELMPYEDTIVVEGWENE
jgi:hypothetical protein